MFQKVRAIDRIRMVGGKGERFSKVVETNSFFRLELIQICPSGIYCCPTGKVDQCRQNIKILVPLSQVVQMGRKLQYLSSHLLGCNDWFNEDLIHGQGPIRVVKDTVTGFDYLIGANAFHTFKVFGTSIWYPARGAFHIVD